MLSYKNYLFLEGIVKTDSDVIWSMTYFSLSKFYQKLAEDMAKTEDKAKQFLSLSKQYQIKFNSTKNKYTTQLDFYTIEVGFEIPEYGYGHFVHFSNSFTYPKKDSRALYVPTHSLIVVNYNSYYYLNTANSLLEMEVKPKHLTYLENDLYATIKHEMIHHIRKTLHEIQNIKQPEMKKDYSDNYESYLTSEVEIESWASDAVEVFKNIIIDIQNDIVIPKSEMLLLLKFWLGEKTPATNRIYNRYEKYINDENVNEFLNAMKIIDKKRHKKIINKVYKELRDFILKENKNG